MLLIPSDIPPETKRDDLGTLLADCRRRLVRFTTDQLTEFDSFSREAGIEVRNFHCCLMLLLMTMFTHIHGRLGMQCAVGHFCPRAQPPLLGTGAVCCCLLMACSSYFCKMHLPNCIK